MSRGEGGQDGVVEGDLPQLLPQQEVGLAVEGGVFVQQLRGDVRLDRAGVGEPLQIEGDAAAEEVGAGLVGAGVSGMEQGRVPVAEGAQRDLGRPAAEERALLAEHLALHEADVGAAEDQEDVARLPPGAVPLLLEDGGELGAGAHDPLELVQGDHVNRRAVEASPLHPGQHIANSQETPDLLGQTRLHQPQPGDIRVVVHGLTFSLQSSAECKSRPT